ncbi:MAG: glycosyltransferase family 2 protein [Pseudomonadota bacterium]|nr:glycosyltransferase family 2 protein [Pseudomonadota bacterium]
MKGEYWVSDLVPECVGKREAAPVSVIIPCYRAAATIARALASVAAQSQSPHEVIVVDDASDDDTCKILKGLVKEYTEGWLKVFFLEKNRGPAAARNYGWERASQPWVAFLDADDTWHVDKLALQLGFMEEHPEFALSGHFCGTAQASASGLPPRFRVFECSLSGLLFRNILRTPSVMLCRDITLRFPEGQRYSEDYHLWLSFLGTGGRAAFLDLPLAATHKPAFGAGGQSAALWPMEKGELTALLAVRRKGHISWPTFVTVVSWSLLKFIRRLLITRLR